MPLVDEHVVFQKANATYVWEPFREDTDYWPAGRQATVNFTVRDLDAMLTQLRTAGSRSTSGSSCWTAAALRGWAVDPEGNRFELWEPTAGPTS